MQSLPLFSVHLAFVNAKVLTLSHSLSSAPFVYGDEQTLLNKLLSNVATNHVGSAQTDATTALVSR